MKLKTLSAFALSALSPIMVAEESQKLLEEVYVFGQKHSESSDAGSRLGLSANEIPATIDVINGDAIRYRGDLTVLDAVTRSAGFVGSGSPGNGGTKITARGFTGQDAVAKLYDGNQYFTLAGTITFPFDTWAVERIDVLKGPASVLYGQGGVAGAINIIPKAASDEFGIDLRLTAGENNERFIGAGVTGTIADNVIGRVDFSQRESDNFVENGASESDMLAVELQWKATEDLTLTLRHDSGDQSPMRYFGTPLVEGKFNRDWLELNLNAKDSRIRYQDDITRVIMDWNISDTLRFNTEVFSLNSDRYWKTLERYSYDSESDMVNRSSPYIIRHQLEQRGVRASLVSDSNLGDMPWKSSVGFEVTDVKMDYISNFNSTHPNRVDWSGDTDKVDPDNFVAGSWADISDSQGALDQQSDVNQLAFFAESQLKLTDKIALVTGLRLDNIETDYERLAYGDSPANPLSQDIDPLMFRLGTVYDINENTALYGQYSTGETHPNGGDVVRVSAKYRESRTVGVDQYEFGIKQAIQENKLNWNLALFQVTKTNLLIDDPDSSDPTDLLSVPEQRSQGIEAGLEYLLDNRLTGYANVAVIDAERDIAGGGSEATPYVPDVTFNTGILFRPVDNVQVVADVRYVDERPYEDTPLDSYAIIDLSLAWIVKENMRLTMNAKNVTDELYASSASRVQWSVGQPRSLSLTLDVNF
jgi:iron complex outermembrane receptor protein|tara:strand:+ start:8205 stop:10310 length:2106 start_codon:yes stop_codon:yes gene_type:complete